MSENGVRPNVATVFSAIMGLFIGRHPQEQMPTLNSFSDSFKHTVLT